MYFRGPKPTFDFRDLMEDAESDNELLQANYDTVNRMILLIGDLTFKSLFTDSWADIIPRIEAKLPEAIHLYLLPGRPDLGAYHAAASFRYLRESHSQESWLSYLNKGGFRSSNREANPGVNELYKHHVALWQQGIYLPYLQGRMGKDVRRLVALENLIQEAGDRTYREYYQRRLKPGRPQFDADLKAKWTPQAVTAFKDAARSGVVFDIAGNSRCCDGDILRCEPGDPNDFCLDCDPADTPCEPLAPPAPPAPV